MHQFKLIKDYLKFELNFIRHFSNENATTWFACSIFLWEIISTRAYKCRVTVMQNICNLWFTQKYMCENTTDSHCCWLKSSCEITALFNANIVSLFPKTSTSNTTMEFSKRSMHRMFIFSEDVTFQIYIKDAPFCQFISIERDISTL